MKTLVLSMGVLVEYISGDRQVVIDHVMQLYAILRKEHLVRNC